MTRHVHVSLTVATGPCMVALIVITATFPAPLGGRTAKMRSVAPAQAEAALRCRRRIVVGLDSETEFAVEIGGGRGDSLEGARDSVVCEFDEVHTILGRCLREVEVGGPRDVDVLPQRVGLELLEEYFGVDASVTTCLGRNSAEDNLVLEGEPFDQDR